MGIEGQGVRGGMRNKRREGEKMKEVKKRLNGESLECVLLNRKSEKLSDGIKNNLYKTVKKQTLHYLR